MFLSFKKLFKKIVNAVIASILSMLGSSLLLVSLFYIFMNSNSGVINFLTLLSMMVVIAILPKFLIKRAMKKEKANMKTKR